jgi:DNA-binding NtrC family response regulator
MLAPYRQGAIMTGSVVILLVEDEAFIQDLVELALQEGGFAVAKASNGDEAMAMLEADETEFHALVSDINLGRGPTGWAVAKRGRELNEHLPVVYVTGGNGHEWASQGVPNSVVVGKPFAAAQIVTAVSQLLNIREH